MHDFKKYQLKFLLYLVFFILGMGLVVIMATKNIRDQFSTRSSTTSPSIAANNADEFIANDFQSILNTKCKPISQLVPATLIIEPQDLPITLDFNIENNFYCISDWRSAPNITVSFYDSDQSYLLFDEDWFHDTLLLKGDASSEYKPNTKGILIRKKDSISQYIMLESRNARFTSDANTWLELYTVKKDTKSDLKVMTHTTLISGANKDFAGVLIRGYIETYSNTPEEYATLMNKIITELLNPIKDPEKSILDAQVEKLSKINFK